MKNDSFIYHKPIYHLCPMRRLQHMHPGDVPERCVLMPGLSIARGIKSPDKKFSVHDENRRIRLFTTVIYVNIDNYTWSLWFKKLEED